MNDPLTVIRDLVPQNERRINPMPMQQTNNLSKESFFLQGLKNAFGGKHADNELGWSEIAEQSKQLIDKAVTHDSINDRTVGALVGLTIGDAAGAPLEFLPARNSQEDKDEPCLLRNLNPETGELQYQKPFNKFKLLNGQWTDDSSMAFCLADSLLARGGFDGGDCRVRWYDWWNFGYNNAFRYDARPDRTSVGLGNNVAMSLDAVSEYTHQLASAVPDRYLAEGDDSGNGSIMRLAPVPIRFGRDLKRTMQIAEAQSYATHPGTDAAACCMMMAFLMTKAIQRPSDDCRNLSEFISEQTNAFLQTHALPMASAGNRGMTKMVSLLKSTPPSNTEAVWAWRGPHPFINETLSARGESYNGHFVTPVYFGSYSMDGIAMALWALHTSENFADCIYRVVNLLGDADTTGAIAGQIAGAFYGYQAISSDPLSARMLKNLNCWDRLHEIPLRALLLNRDGAPNE